jgi:two-component system, NarL family, response regulator NreC
MIRILLADDHTLFRRGLRRILEEEDQFTVVAEAASGLEAIELAGQLRPDVAVLDIAMKELNGVEATAQLIGVSPKTAVLILSMHSDERYVSKAIKAGAHGYILKDSVEEDLIRAIHLLHKGQSFFSPAYLKSIEERSVLGFGSREIEDRYELLSERERQLYHLLADGKSNKEIASRLNLSLHTVETHRTHIMEKLGIHSIAELVIGAVRRGHLLPE